MFRAVQVPVDDNGLQDPQRSKRSCHIKFCLYTALLYSKLLMLQDII